jgi:hypothetical protein
MGGSPLVQLHDTSVRSRPHPARWQTTEINARRSTMSGDFFRLIRAGSECYFIPHQSDFVNFTYSEKVGIALP